MRLFAFFLGFVAGLAADLIGAAPIYNALAAGLIGLILGLVCRADRTETAWFAVAGIGLGTFVAILAVAAFSLNFGWLLLGACFGLLIAGLNGLGAAAGVWLAALILRFAGMIGRK